MSDLIIYNTPDGKSSIALYAKDGSVWLNQNQISELFATSKQNTGQHISSLLKKSEQYANSVVKNYFTTATDGKNPKLFRTSRHELCHGTQIFYQYQVPDGT
ncbi:MAG: hypothetical protein PHF97_09155 [Bacteroidales bacterium]|nr:hypothetical protein [Bacteroidales bacterium]